MLAPAHPPGTSLRWRVREGGAPLLGMTDARRHALVAAAKHDENADLNVGGPRTVASHFNELRLPSAS